MVQIQRVSAQAPITVEKAQLISPSDFPFSTAGAEAFKSIGGVLNELEQRRKKAQDSLSITDTNNSQRFVDAEIKQFMTDNPDPDGWGDGIEKILQRQSTLVSQLKSSPETRVRIDQSQKAFREQTVLNGSILQTQATIEIDVQSSGAALITAMGTGNELEITEARDTHEAALLRKEAPEIAALSLVETLKEGEQERVAVLVQEGRFDEAEELVRQSKAFEAEEAVQTLKRIEISRKQLEGKTLDLNQKADMAVNTDFVQQIITKDLTPDEVEASRLKDKTSRGIFGTDKLSKAEWIRYSSASFDDPPKKTTPQGLETASGIVFDKAKNRISTETAYRRLLDSRYIQKEITDDDFQWAMDKVNNPYPIQMVVDIESVMQSNSDAILRSGFFDRLITTDAEEEKVRTVNTDLREWIDSELAEKRTPTRAQMYDKSAQLRSQSPEISAAPVIISTQKEYDKLPTGTEYIDSEDGQAYRKQ